MRSKTLKTPPFRQRIQTLLACLVLAITVAALSPPGTARAAGGASYAGERYYDPFEPVNRGIFVFNQAIDEMLLKPAARLYILVMPDRGQIIVSNIIANLKSPVILANDLLQGDLDRAQTTIARFAVNTILGFGGMGDVAADLGAPGHGEDFGQTAAIYGIGSGPYLMLPFFGPSNLRDAIGKVADTFLDPLDYALDNRGAFTRAGLEGLEMRAEFLDVSEALEKTSIDYYASIRSVFSQNRAYEIRNGDPELIVDIYGDAPDLPSK
jgi:phospholipid-binding lipoprotein MlaA